MKIWSWSLVLQVKVVRFINFIFVLCVFAQADVLCLFVAFDQDLLGFRWRLQEGTLISTDFPLYTTELTLASLHTSAPRVAYLCHGLFHCVRGW